MIKITVAGSLLVMIDSPSHSLKAKKSRKLTTKEKVQICRIGVGEGVIEAEDRHLAAVADINTS